MESPDAFYAQVCRYLTAVRKAKNLKQTDVGERLSLTGSMVCYMEKGRSRIPLHVFIKWCEVLEVDVAMVLTDFSRQKKGKEDAR